MPLYAALTVGDLELRLARSVGDALFDGTATAGAASSLTDAAMPWATNDDEAVLGAWVRLFAGTSAGDERVAATPYTGSTGLMTVDRAFTATPDTTTKYYICRQHRPIDYLRALQDAQRYQADHGLNLAPVIGREVIVGNLVPNGGFDLFTTADTPDGTWTIQGADTEENTITYGPRSAYSLVSNGTDAAFIRHALTGWGKFKGKTVRCYAMARASIASRVTLEFNDGVGTASTDTVTTNNVWELLEVSRAFSDAATQARVSIEVTSGGAVTVQVQFLYVADPDPSYEQAPIDVDRRLAAISSLRLSTQSVLAANGRGYSFGPALALKNFQIVRDTEDTPRQLRLDVAGNHRGHVLEYTGWKTHAEFTGPTVTYGTAESPGRPELILPRARAILLRDAGAEDGVVEAAEKAAERAETRLRVGPTGSFRRVA